MNGIIEVVTLFFIPFFLALLFHRTIGINIGFFIISTYGLFNLVSFGSKFSALYPILVFSLVSLLLGRITLQKLILPFIIIFGTYTFINPYYFRIALAEGRQLSFWKAIVESNFLATVNGINILTSLRNLSVRVTGIISMQWAISSSEFYTRSTLFVNRYINDVFLKTAWDNNYAVGHFGYFMVMLGNHFWGLLLGLFVLWIYLKIILYFDRARNLVTGFRRSMIGLAFIMGIFPLLIDGQYDNISSYLHLALEMIGTYLLLNIARISIHSSMSRDSILILDREENNILI